jgi:nicotinamidase-related amidase
MRDCLLLVDVFGDFSHEDGDALLESFQARFPELEALVRDARRLELPVIYANDSFGVFDGDMRAIVDRALRGPAGEQIGQIAPRRGDRFVVKPRYSAFDYTPLALILEHLGVERILLAGMSTEGCVAQTAIAAKEEGYKVTVVESACSTVDPALEETALAYLRHVVGARLATAVQSA